MDIRELRYITEIGRTKHLTKAASNLYISQPALSKALKKVENELNTHLFYREGNELRPTDTGTAILEIAGSIIGLFSKIDDCTAAINNLKRGNVSFGFPIIVGSMYFPQVLVEFRTKYPDIQLQIIEAGGAELTDMVISGKVDMAVVMRPVVSDVLNEFPIVKNEVVVAVNKTHPWANREFLTIKELENIPFNTFDNTFVMYHLLMERFVASNVIPRIDLTSADCNLLLQFTILSNGVLILPKLCIDFYHQDDIVTIPFRPSFPWELCVIFKKNTYMTNAVKALIGHIHNSFNRR